MDPYTLVRTVGKSVDVTLPSGMISAFSINFFRLSTRRIQKLPRMVSRIRRKTIRMFLPVTRMTSRTIEWSLALVINLLCDIGQAHANLAKVAERKLFTSSRLEEIETPRNLGCFEIFTSEKADGYRLYRSTFVEKVKKNGSMRSRLCVASCIDQNHGLLPPAPTIKRVSLRL